MNSYHNHCNWSDGAHEMRDMYRAAREAGFREFGLSDHYVKTPFGDNEITAYSIDKSKLAEYVDACLSCKKEFDKPEFLVHTSDLMYKFRNEIAEKAKFRLINRQTGEPLKVVEHIGCHYAKMFPSKGVGGAEYPYVLAGMIDSWGGNVIDYPERRHCCGYGFRQYHIKANRGYCLSNTHKKFESMEPYKPDMIITNCPGCNYFMDRWQYVIAETLGKTYGEGGYGIPTLTYEEVAGLVLGYDPWDLGLQMHQVAVEPLLDKIGVPYNPDTKYDGVDGRKLAKPEFPVNLRCC